MFARPQARRSIRRWVLGLLISGGAVFRVQTASAQTPGELTVARARFKEATELEAQKKWAQAAVKLREALSIKKTAGLHYHLAVCEERQGNLVEAQLEYDRSQELLDAGEKAPDVQKLLTQARKKLEGRVPTMVLLLPKQPAEIRLELDGAPLKRASVSAPLPLNPGRHSLRVLSEGHEPFQVVFHLREGERKLLTVELKKSPTKPASLARGGREETKTKTSAPAPTKDHTRTWVLLGEAALAAVGVGAGVFYQLEANSANTEAARARGSLDQRSGGSAACGDPGISAEHAADCGQLGDFERSKEDNEQLALFGFGAGALGLASLAITWLVWDPEGPPANAGSPRLLATPTADGAWLGVRGNF